MPAPQISPFALVGAKYRIHHREPKKPALSDWLRDKPVTSVLLLTLIVLGCVFADCIAAHDPQEFYLPYRNQPPDATFWFGTDALGRDIFSNIWYGGRTSLFIGIMSAGIITVLGITWGCIAGTASAALDTAMMRLVEMAQSIPALLSLLLLSSLVEEQTPLTLSCIIGITGWFSLARIVRSEVRQIRNSDYVLASQCMGGSFFHVMRHHLVPNFVSAVMFVIISGVSTSIGMESTLSFLGLGLPVEHLSWGSMLTFADRALLLNTWWVIVIPGTYLVVTLVCITSLGHHYRKHTNRGANHLL